MTVSIKLLSAEDDYLLGSSRRFGERRRVRVFLGTLRTPRTMLLLVLGGIGGIHAYYNSYFDIVVIAPFNQKGTVILFE